MVKQRLKIERRKMAVPRLAEHDRALAVGHLVLQGERGVGAQGGVHLVKGLCGRWGQFFLVWQISGLQVPLRLDRLSKLTAAGGGELDGGQGVGRGAGHPVGLHMGCTVLVIALAHAVPIGRLLGSAALRAARPGVPTSSGARLYEAGSQRNAEHAPSTGGHALQACPHPRPAACPLASCGHSATHCRRGLAAPPAHRVGGWAGPRRQPTHPW